MCKSVDFCACVRACVCFPDPELGADSGLASGCSHLQGLLVVPAAHLLKQVVDEVQPGQRRKPSVALGKSNC